MSSAAQQEEIRVLLDRAVALKLNAIILQVRPCADAIYPSELEPWSEYLSGEQGRGPWLEGEAAWDPLAFWVREAHRRGLELHAWFNPFRARQNSAKSAASAKVEGGLADVPCARGVATPSATEEAPKAGSALCPVDAAACGSGTKSGSQAGAQTRTCISASMAR